MAHWRRTLFQTLSGRRLHDSIAAGEAMQTATEPAYSASSPPFILNTDMSGGRLDSDPDFEFFDSSNLDTANSPRSFLVEDFATGSPQFMAGFGSPNTNKNPSPERAALLDTDLHPSLSAPSTASPAGSYQDSSSDSSGYKRKSSSDSSRSLLTNGDPMMADDLDMEDWKVADLAQGNDAQDFGRYDGTINPEALDANFAFNDKSMENDFDFESAASSPSPFGNGPVEMESPEMPTIKHDTPKGKGSPMLKTKYKKHHNKAHSVGSHLMLSEKTVQLISTATICYPVYERANNFWLEGGLPSLCDGDKPRIFSLRILQQLAISWHRYGVCQRADDGWGSTSKSRLGIRL